MHAVRIQRSGGPDVLALVERPDPEPDHGELLVEVHAAGVNYIDTYHRSGLYPVELPSGLGLEGAGRVLAVGHSVAGFAVGDRVAWTNTIGSYAQRVVVPADGAVAVPDGVSDDDAAAALLQGMTAHYLATDTYPVQRGDTVLVHAAAGGVGLLLTQLVTARGATVIATVSTPEKERLARDAGATEVIRYTETDDLATQVRARTGGDGVAAVFDGVGATTFDAGIESLRRRGTLVLFGGSSGPVPPVDPQRLNAAGSLYLTRPKLFDYIATPDELRARAAAVFGAIADETLRLRISQRYPMRDAGQAHQDLEARRTTGKLLLVP